MFLKIVAFIFLISGLVTVYGAKWAVSKFGLDAKTTSEFEEEMSEEELKQYKYNKAVVNCKMLGMILALPGLILVVIAFK